MSKQTFGLVLGFVALVSGAMFFIEPGTASAEIDGNCSAFFKGVDVTPLDSTSPGDAILVQEDEIVDIVFQSNVGFQSHKVTVQFADIGGTKIDADSDDDDGGDNQWTGDVNVDDWATYGAGLYRVEGTATLTDGTECSGAVLVDVDKNPLTTIAGIVALLTGMFGAGSIAASGATSVIEGRRASRRIEDWVTNELANVGSGRPYTPPNRGALIGELMDAWCLFMVLPAIILTGAAMASGGASTSPSSINLPRASWRPRLSIAGTIGGILFGLGLVVLLQQFGEVFPNIATVLIYIAAGLVLGIVIPSIIRFVNVMTVNGALSRAEKRLAEAAMGGGGSAAVPAEPAAEPPSTSTPDDAPSDDGGKDG